MTTRPLPLPGWAMRALDEERLTQWRWRLKAQPPEGARAVQYFNEPRWAWVVGTSHVLGEINLPIAPGTRLWVQETWGIEPERRFSPAPGERIETIPEEIFYKIDDPNLSGMHWRSPVTMPRWASRWTLTVESVRVERVRDVTIHDAEAEGVLWAPGDHSRKESYAREWERRHGPGAWERDWCAVATISAERGNGL